MIISGFAIYGLILALEPIEIKVILTAQSEAGVHSGLWGATTYAVYVLIVNLIIHVILRGLWIGAIGLRYVSGDIDYDSLNYSKKFTTYLKTNVGSFDKFIAKLENFCSVLFALSFLMIFYILAFIALFSFTGVTMSFLMELDFIPKIVMRIIIIILGFIIGVGTLLVFIDFVGQGILKKRKWTSTLYFPFYKLFSFLTLSFLYRPLVYNFLDNKFSRRLSIIIVPFYIGLILLSSFDDISSNYLTNNNPSSENYSNVSNYDDLVLEKNQFLDIATIPSKTIQTSYLKVFLLYKKEMEDFVFETNESLKPKEDKRGPDFLFIDDFKAGWEKAENNGAVKDSILPQYLETFNSLYTLSIDNANYQSDFIVSKNANSLLGFETYLNIKDLSEGKHLLHIRGPLKTDSFDKESETIQKTLITIPFWYFPDNAQTKSITNELETDTLTNK